MTEPIIYTCPDLAPIALSEGSEDLVYEKQAIYVGTFHADNGEHTVTDQDINHWVKEFTRMSENGVDVPVPLEHTDDPEKRRGTVIGMRAANDQEGRYSLFTKIRFNKKEDAERGNQVSVFVPPSYRDGKGNEYYRPVRHVALTDYPVVPGLAGFEKVLAASLVKKKKVNNMENLIQLLNTELGLQLDPTANEATVYAAVKAAIDAAKLAPPDEANPGEPPGDTPPPGNTPPPPPQQMSASLVKLVNTSREGVIDNLVTQGKITPAVAKKLKGEYTGKDKLALAFSQDTGDFSDNFDGVIAALQENEPVLSFAEKTKSQVLPKEGNILIQDAESRK